MCEPSARATVRSQPRLPTQQLKLRAPTHLVYESGLEVCGQSVAAYPFHNCVVPESERCEGAWKTQLRIGRHSSSAATSIAATCKPPPQKPCMQIFSLLERVRCRSTVPVPSRRALLLLLTVEDAVLHAVVQCRPRRVHQEGAHRWLAPLLAHALYLGCIGISARWRASTIAVSALFNSNCRDTSYLRACRCIGRLLHAPLPHCKRASIWQHASVKVHRIHAAASFSTSHAANYYGQNQCFTGAQSEVTLSTRETPAMVPPVPAPITKASTSPAVCSQICSRARTWLWRSTREISVCANRRQGTLHLRMP
eukprot:3235484-Pleurochrysis_carterae.AAC.3